MKRQSISKNLKVVVLGFIYFTFTFGLMGAAGAAETRGVSATEVRIGIVPDLTGPSARGCRGHLWGIKNYLNEINAKGGIYGRKIRLFIQDGKYNPSVGMRAFKKLVLKAKVFAMIGNMGSAPVKAQLPLIKKYKMPLISPAVVSHWISYPPKKYVFSTMLSQGYCARVLIDYVVDEIGDKNPRIGVLFVNTELGHESIREIREHTGMYGFNVTAAVSYAPGSISLAGQIAKLKAAGVDYVMLCGITIGAVYACKEAAKLDWKPQFLFPGVMTEETIFSLGKGAVFYGKAPIGASEYFPISADFPAKKIMQKWLEKDPQKKVLSLSDLHGLTYAKTLVEGLKRTGKDLSVEGFIHALEGIKNWDNGGQSTISFGQNNRQGVTKVLVFKGIKEGPDEIGKWDIIKMWTEPKKR
jgi:branched-chain amino acid transport system substrate-binding protein